MNWIDGMITGGGCVAALGIVKTMVMSKVNKPECDLKHNFLNTTLTDMKKDTKDSFTEIKDGIKDMKTELLNEIKNNKG